MKRTERAWLQKRAEGDLIPWRVQGEFAAAFGVTLAAAERTILEAGLFPARYQRNRRLLAVDGQLRLFRSRVGVIGCGGLGGYIIEQLARLGVGEIVAIDPDIFVEHNLNRQILSSPRLLGVAKAEVAAARVADINPAVTVIPRPVFFDVENGGDLLAGCAVAVDALDSVKSRLDLSVVCRRLNIPLVHGAIGGWYGQVLTQIPGEEMLESLYTDRETGKGVEKDLGNPSFTPAVVASLQVAETVKILLGVGTTLRGRKLAVDLLGMEMAEIPL